MKITTLLICLLMLALACGGVLAQSWASAITSGITAVEFTKVGYEYTLILHNMTGIPGDQTVGYDVLVWTLEPFNLPAPETILEMPHGPGWTWMWSEGGFKMFEVADPNRKYFTPPALAPGGTYTFKYTSTLTTPVNPGGPSDGSPGFLSHVAAIDPSTPGSDTQRWTAVIPEGTAKPTWYDHSEVPEPGSLVTLAAGLLGTAGFLVRRRK